MSEQQQFDESLKLIEKKDFQNALKLLQNVIKKNPKRGRAWFFIGYCYQHTNDLKNAIIAYKKGNELEPEYYGNLLQLGYTFELQKDDIQAYEIYKQLVSKFPTKALGWFNLGCCCSRLERFSEAISALEKSLELDPKYLQAKLALAITYEGMNEIEKALSLRTEYSFHHGADSFNYFNIAKLYQRKNDIEESLAFIIKALSLDRLEEYQIELERLLSSVQIPEGHINVFDFVDKSYYGKLEIENQSIKSIKQIFGLNFFKYVLKNLNLSNNQIEKIEGLDKCIKLEMLSLRNNRIEKIEGLDKLYSLYSLNLSNNKITEMDGLESCSLLQIINLSNNDIQRYVRLSSLQYIKELNLNGNEKLHIKYQRFIPGRWILEESKEKHSPLLGKEFIPPDHWEIRPGVKYDDYYKIRKEARVKHYTKPHSEFFIIPFYSECLSWDNTSQCLYCNKIIKPEDNSSLYCGKEFEKIITGHNNQIPTEIIEDKYQVGTRREYRISYIGSTRYTTPVDVSVNKKYYKGFSNFKSYPLEYLAGPVCINCTNEFLLEVGSTIAKNFNVHSKNFDTAYTSIGLVKDELDRVIDKWIQRAERNLFLR